MPGFEPLSIGAAGTWPVLGTGCALPAVQQSRALRGEWSGALPLPSPAEQAGGAGSEGWMGIHTSLSPSGCCSPVLAPFFTLSAAMLNPGLRNGAAASRAHLPQRSKGKTSINQHISTSVPVHKGAEIGLWSLCNCFTYKEKKGNKSVG